MQATENPTWSVGMMAAKGSKWEIRNSAGVIGEFSHGRTSQLFRVTTDDAQQVFVLERTAAETDEIWKAGAVRDAVKVGTKAGLKVPSEEWSQAVEACRPATKWQMDTATAAQAHAKSKGGLAKKSAKLDGAEVVLKKFLLQGSMRGYLKEIRNLLRAVAEPTPLPSELLPDMRH